MLVFLSGGKTNDYEGHNDHGIMQNQLNPSRRLSCEQHAV